MKKLEDVVRELKPTAIIGNTTNTACFLTSSVRLKASILCLLLLVLAVNLRLCRFPDAE